MGTRIREHQRISFTYLELIHCLRILFPIPECRILGCSAFGPDYVRNSQAKYHSVRLRAFQTTGIHPTLNGKSDDLVEIKGIEGPIGVLEPGVLFDDEPYIRANWAGHPSWRMEELGWEEDEPGQDDVVYSSSSSGSSSESEAEGEAGE